MFVLIAACAYDWALKLNEIPFNERVAVILNRGTR